MITEDFIFHYQRRDDGKLVHDVCMTFSGEEEFSIAPVLEKIRQFLNALGYECKEIQIVTHKKYGE